MLEVKEVKTKKEQRDFLNFPLDLYKDNPYFVPPLYMDETLSQLDDNRARNAIKVLDGYSKHAQCVLFTCQARDLELAKEISSINLIEL